MVRVRRLVSADAHIWRRLSLEAIACHPEAFMTRLEEERAIPLSNYADAIAAGTEVFVAGQDNGMALLRVRGVSGSVHGFYVQPASRRQGVADALMLALIPAARKASCRTLELGVFGDNRAAVAFYQKHGFSQQSSEPFGQRESWTMTLQLD